MNLIKENVCMRQCVVWFSAASAYLGVPNNITVLLTQVRTQCSVSPFMSQDHVPTVAIPL